MAGTVWLPPPLYPAPGRFLQRQTGGGAVHRLAGEFRQVHLDIGSDDHQIRLGHLFRVMALPAPTEPRVSTFTHQPRFWLRFRMASAAIKVWATPVGQAVTATMRFCP